MISRRTNRRNLQKRTRRSVLLCMLVIAAPSPAAAQASPWKGALSDAEIDQIRHYIRAVNDRK
jgi:hypothetical protein